MNKYSNDQELKFFSTTNAIIFCSSYSTYSINCSLKWPLILCIFQRIIQGYEIKSSSEHFGQGYERYGRLEVEKRFDTEAVAQVIIPT